MFVDHISMEGVYKAVGRPTIVISALRPLSRRAFTFWAHMKFWPISIFNHGSTIDELQDEVEQRRSSSPKEFLVRLVCRSCPYAGARHQTGLCDSGAESEDGFA